MVLMTEMDVRLAEAFAKRYKAQQEDVIYYKNEWIRACERATANARWAREYPKLYCAADKLENVLSKVLEDKVNIGEIQEALAEYRKFKELKKESTNEKNN